jgi:hypothetical protein
MPATGYIACVPYSARREEADQEEPRRTLTTRKNDSATGRSADKCMIADHGRALSPKGSASSTAVWAKPPYLKNDKETK